MFVGQMSVDQMPVDQMSVGPMPSDQVSVNQMSVGQMFVVQMFFGQITRNPLGRPWTRNDVKNIEFTSVKNVTKVLSYLSMRCWCYKTLIS